MGLHRTGEGDRGGRGLTTSFANVDGVSIRIHHLGGSGPPLVCVHATGFHGRVWEPFVPRLREHFSIVALDQRGHGDSDKPESGYEWTRFGEDVLGVIDELGLQAPAGIGHSAGAAALLFAETMRPGAFSRLVLMDPVTPQPDVRGFMGSEENPMAHTARKRRADWTSHEEMIDRLRQGSSPLHAWQPEFLRAYVAYGTTPTDDGFRLKCPPSVEAEIYLMGGRHEGYERLADITCPTLMLVGSGSQMWSPDRAEAAAERIPGGRLETVEGGHFFPMENPDGTLDALEGFLLGDG